MSFLHFIYSRIYLSLIVVILTTACMSIPNLKQNAAFLPPVNIEKTTSTAFKTPYFKQGEWPSLKWWEAFNDEYLGKLIQESLESNPSIQAFQQKVLIAKQMAIKSKSTLFPSIYFQGNETWEHLSLNSYNHLVNPTLGRNFNNIQINFGFNYEFDFWGKYSNLFRASLGREQAKKAEYKQVELSVSIAIAQAYFSLKTYMAEKRLYQKVYEFQKESLRLTNLLYKKALFSKIQPATLRQELDAVEKHLFTLESEIAVRKHLVNILRGQSPDAELLVSDLLDPLPNNIEIPKNLSSDLLIRRPDLLAAIWRVEASAYDANAAVADFFPRVNLMGFMGVDSLGYKHLMNWQSGTMALMPSFHIPIFKAGEIKANFRMKKAELESAIYDYNDLLLKSLQEVSDLIALTTSWYEKKKAQNSIIENAQLKVHLVNLRAKRGIDNLLQVYLEEVDKLKKEIDDVQITYNQYISVINLIKSLGGGYTNEDLRRLKIQGIE